MPHVSVIIQYLCEISKQSIEDTAWLFLSASIKMWEERRWKMDYSAEKEENIKLWNTQPVHIEKKKNEDTKIVAKWPSDKEINMDHPSKQKPVAILFKAMEDLSQRWFRDHKSSHSQLRLRLCEHGRHSFFHLGFEGQGCLTSHRHVTTVWEGPRPWQGTASGAGPQ